MAHHGRPRNTHRGYTLLEAMIVIGLVSVMIGVTAFWLQNQARNETRENWTLTQAKEMAMIAGAVQSYIASNPAPLQSLADSTTLSPALTVDQLITSGALPTNFANRRTAVDAPANRSASDTNHD